MSGQALYRRWRSQTFDEIIAQEHVTRTLQNALRGGRIVHAYLFTGPRGTGKTSMARILAKAVNCLAEPGDRPCNGCPRCRAVNEGRDLDLIEIDAASNRGIDEIRELRDKIAFAPTEGRYKVYVVDEVHMLTMEAFNALLKTLEEPPPHVIFVLATTEPQKIPATILSRCQRFDFRRIPLADLSRKLERICEAEQIQIEPAAVQAIARRAGGSFRDGESLLDQLAAYGEAEITLERVRDLLGGVSTAAVADLVDAWLAADLGGGLKLINGLVDQGADARQLHLDLIEYLRSLLLLQAGGDEKLANVSPEMASRMRQQVAGLSLGRLVDGLRLFSQGEALARGEVRPQLPLELAFVQAVLLGASREEGREPAARPAAASASHASPGPAPVGTRSRAPARRDEAPAVARQAGAAGERPATAEAPRDPTPRGEPGAGLSFDWLSEKWTLFLQEVRARDPKLQALLRSARPAEVAGARVVLEASSTFHRDHIMEEKNRRIMEEVLEKLSGGVCQVECGLAGRRTARAARGGQAEDPELHEDRIVSYAVRDLGAHVARVQKVDAAEPRTDANGGAGNEPRIARTDANGDVGNEPRIARTDANGDVGNEPRIARTDANGDVGNEPPIARTDANGDVGNEPPIARTDANGHVGN